MMIEVKYYLLKEATSRKRNQKEEVYSTISKQFVYFWMNEKHQGHLQPSTRVLNPVFLLVGYLEHLLYRLALSKNVPYKITSSLIVMHLTGPSAG